MRRLTALALAAVLALGAAACGDDDDEPARTTTTQAAEPAVSLEEAKDAIAGVGDDKPAARPNVLGQTGPIEGVLDRLDRDVVELYAVQLEPKGAKVVAPQVQRAAGAGPCNGRRLTSEAPPQWCEDESTAFETPQGAEAVRQGKDGLVRLLLLVAWAQTQGVGDGLGWHDAVADGRYTADEVAETEFCLLTGWVFYNFLTRVFDKEDQEAVLRLLSTDPAFEKVPMARRQAAFEKGIQGADNCYE